MPGPEWSRDATQDGPLIVSNCTSLLTELLADSPQRAIPTAVTVKAWHAHLYAGCSVPVPAYVGHFRGDPSHPALVGYDVGVGMVRPDGFPDGVGVWSDQVHDQIGTFFDAVRSAVDQLDDRFPAGIRLTTADDLEQVVWLAALLHGEWIRIHPFANGNGRIARVWTAFAAFRYGLPAFVPVKPRHDSVLYTRAAANSMGRPPNFVGSHDETFAVFVRWLRIQLGA